MPKAISRLSHALAAERLRTKTSTLTVATELILGRANARLIAAAPDLLATAKEALAFIKANGLSHGRSLEAAIAQAEGRVKRETAP